MNLEKRLNKINKVEATQMMFLETVPPFCEGSLNEGAPEYLNTASSLCMWFWCYYRYTRYCDKNELSRDIHFIYSLLLMNCIFSGVFHWTLVMGWKMFDEITMMLPLWVGIQSILFVLYDNEKKKLRRSLHVLNTSNVCLIVLNTFPTFQPFFPIAFGVEMLFLGYLYTELVKFVPDKNKTGERGIQICVSSGLIWGITEVFCHRYLIFGHLLWHIGMPVGVDCIIQYVLFAYKEKNPRLLHII